MSSDIQNSDEPATRFEGYSDYQAVSQSVASAIEDAIDAYAAVRARHTEQQFMKEHEASQASANILGAAMRLQHELKKNKDTIDEAGDIVERWQGEDGFIRELERTRLADECPDWLRQFVADIRAAGWELGYLQAGRTVSEGDDDPVKEGVGSAFDGLQE